MNIYVFLAAALGAYLVGSIPFGLIYGLIRGTDIRTIGSGNIGATNCGRAFGFWGGFLPVFILDGIKGAAPVLAVRLIGIDFSIFSMDASSSLELAMIVMAVLTVVGHMFPVYLKFKGGKGVSTTAGAFASIMPLHILMALGVFLTVFFIAKKKVAPSSLIAAVSIPFLVAFVQLPAETMGIPMLIVSILISVLVIFQHRSNIKQMFSKEP